MTSPEKCEEESHQHEGEDENENENYYSKHIILAGEHEKMYNIIVKKNMYVSYEEERKKPLNLSIEERKKGDEHKHTAENRIQIAKRYAELGDVSKDFMSYYKNSGHWYLSAFNTAYNSGKTSLQISIINDILHLYDKIIERTDKNNEEHIRAEELKKIFNKILYYHY